MTKKKLRRRIQRLQEMIDKLELFVKAEAAETLDRDHQLFEMIEQLLEGGVAVVVHEPSSKAN